MERPPQADWIPHPHSLETQDLFHPLQLGFCCKHSGSAPFAQLTDLWFSAINRSDLSKNIFLYLKKEEEKKRLILLITKSYSQSFLSIYTKLNSLPFSVHTLKIEYNVSLSVGPTLLKELFQKGQSWDLYSSASILMTYLNIYHQTLQNVICSHNKTTLHTTGESLKSIMQIQKTQQLCLDHI